MKSYVGINREFQKHEKERKKYEIDVYVYMLNKYKYPLYNINKFSRLFFCLYNVAYIFNILNICEVHIYVYIMYSICSPACRVGPDR